MLSRPVLLLPVARAFLQGPELNTTAIEVERNKLYSIITVLDKNLEFPRCRTTVDSIVVSLWRQVLHEHDDIVPSGQDKMDLQ